ncbi:MAG: hypothetical protein Q9162_003804 [Coniocarpon cinnabarinum]
MASLELGPFASFVLHILLEGGTARAGVCARRFLGRTPNHPPPALLVITRLFGQLKLTLCASQVVQASHWAILDRTCCKDLCPGRILRTNRPRTFEKAAVKYYGQQHMCNILPEDPTATVAQDHRQQTYYPQHQYIPQEEPQEGQHSYSSSTGYPPTTPQPGAGYYAQPPAPAGQHHGAYQAGYAPPPRLPSMNANSPATAQLSSQYAASAYGQTQAAAAAGRLPSLFRPGDPMQAHAMSSYSDSPPPQWHQPPPRITPERHFASQSLPPLSHVMDRPGFPRSSTHESFVGAVGFPDPMPSRGPKARFTAEEDSLLKRLKEDYTQPKLSWKQIADFFPDRKSGTLQVRYCTKLRRKDDFQWNPEIVRLPPIVALPRLTSAYKDNELRQAAQVVEAEKWRSISQKLNGKISPTQCQERLETLEAEEFKRQGNEDWEIANQ